VSYRIIYKNLIDTVFQDISLKGFWMTAWTKENIGSQKRLEMYDELATLFKEKKLQSPSHILVPFSNYQEAVTKTLSFNGRVGAKYILDLTKF